MFPSDRDLITHEEDLEPEPGPERVGGKRKSERGTGGQRERKRESEQANEGHLWGATGLSCCKVSLCLPIEDSWANVCYACTVTSGGEGADSWCGHMKHLGSEGVSMLVRKFWRDL